LFVIVTTCALLSVGINAKPNNHRPIKVMDAFFMGFIGLWFCGLMVAVCVIVYV